MKRLPMVLFLVCWFLGERTAFAEEAPLVRVASKTFTESVVLGEMVTALAETDKARVKHFARLGGTRLAWEALLSGDIDVYPEYTGTITQEILADLKITTDSEARQALAERGIVMSQPLGFNNTYAMGMREQQAEELGIRTISDLVQHPELKLGFSSEFIDRSDGWPGLQASYQLPQKNVSGLNHDLAYRGIQSGSLDVIDLYTTDAEIAEYDLRVLEDDRGYFPAYQAVLLYRKELADSAPDVLLTILKMQNRISAAQMRSLNAKVKLEGQTESDVAARYLQEELGVDVLNDGADSERSFWGRWWQVAISIWQRTLQHLTLTSISLFSAILVAIPLGILSAKQKLFGQIVLGTVGIVQTVPTLAIFVFLIPLFGIGPIPAIVALFLYSLLGIVRNTYSGLHDIPQQFQESAEALGLPELAQLRLIELPMASRSILAGIKTAAVINVGTATLGGFIGAGGYGAPIFTGISRGDIGNDSARSNPRRRDGLVSARAV